LACRVVVVLALESKRATAEYSAVARQINARIRASYQAAHTGLVVRAWRVFHHLSGPSFNL